MDKEKQVSKQAKIIDKETIGKFRLQIIQQLQEAKEKKLYWIKKEIGLEASLAACEHILKLPEAKEVEEKKKGKGDGTGR